MKPSFIKIWVLGFGLLGITLLWSVYNAFVPVFLQTGRPDFQAEGSAAGYGLSAGMTGFVMTLDNLAALLILPWVGAWSDRTHTRWGRRKPFILAGAPLAALGFAAVPFALGHPLPFFMAAVGVTLLAMDLIRTPITALMPDLTPPAQRSQANGIISLMSGIGGVLAFKIGGDLREVSPAAPFLFGAAGLLLCCGILVGFVREPQTPEAPDEPEPGLLNSIRTLWAGHDSSALLLLGGVFFAFLEFFAVETFFTSYAVDFLKVASGKASGFLSYFALAVVLGAVPAGWAGGRYGRRRIILVGMGLLASVLAWGYTLTSTALVAPMLAAAGLCWALILVNLLPMVLDFAPAGREGAYTGLYLLAQQLAAVTAPILAGWVFEATGNDYRMLFMYGPATLLGAMGLVKCVRR